MISSEIGATENIMRRIRLGKIVLNMGVGKSGDALERAKRVMEGLVGQRPCVRRARRTVRDFGIHMGEPIGVMVTLRGGEAIEMLRRLLAAKGMKLKASSISSYGNFSFGIGEHIEVPGVKYDPELGIFGMDVSVSLERLGYRVLRRRRMTSKIGTDHRISKEEAIKFFEQEFQVEVL